MTTKAKPRKPAAKPAGPIPADEREKHALAVAALFEQDNDDNSAMVKFAELGEDQIVDLRHVDELNRMKSRLYGIEATVIGVHGDSEDELELGILWLISDVVERMHQCAEAFEAVRQVRRARHEGKAKEDT